MTEGAAGLDTTAIEVAIHALEARDEPDRLWVEARAELAALVEAAGRATALAAACAAKDEALRALLPCFGALGLRMVRAGEFAAHAESLGRIAARADATLALGADAGPGAAGARDETRRKAAAYDALVAQVREHEREGHNERWVLGEAGRQLLADAWAGLDALRAGGAGETGTEG